MAKDKKSTGDYDKNGDLEEVEAKEAPKGAAAKQKLTPMQQAMEPDRTDPEPGEHVPAKDARFRVENTAAGDLGLTIGPRDPYPTGNPRDPREEFYDINGFYAGEGGTGGIAGVKKTDKPNQEA